MEERNLPKISDVWQAQERVYRFAIETPVVVRAGLHLKLENLQPIGAFKIRGAANHLLAHAGSLGKGVITASSGNHGRAVAYVSRALGIPCVVVVPENIPQVKAQAILDLGARMVMAGTTSAARHERAFDLQRQEDLHFVPSFDDPYIIAGQGTVGLELVRQVPNARTILVPTSGGGLISGISLAIKCLRPDIRVVGVEPAGGRRFFLSRQAGHPVDLDRVETLADGLRVSQPGQYTWELTQRYVDDFIAVNDEEILDAMRWCMLQGPFVAEPSGAVTVAAALRENFAAPVVAVISGGNADAVLLQRALERTATSTDHET